MMVVQMDHENMSGSGQKFPSCQPFVFTLQMAECPLRVSARYAYGLHGDNENTERGWFFSLASVRRRARLPVENRMFLTLE